MKTGRYNISKLFNSPEIEQIVIPELQRDYVWGERNVKGLLTSILNNYKSKKSERLVISDNSGENLSDDIQKYLTDEYMRLRYNTRVGFIYAYHDRTLFGQYYLIDGQQRLTTIFLLLLALYRRSEHRDLFRSRYFTGSLPKIDYKVRDVAHNFLKAFIDFELTNEDYHKTFRDSPCYYIEYDRDITSKSIYSNYYKVIVPMLKDYDDVDSLIDYVENYIEFNYFDTNMSEQGEKLYLYMNSRGEALSSQEKIKSIIIGRSKSKLEAGEEWENWQNFFWQRRGDDENADRGFFEFIKWAVILHYFQAHRTETSSLKILEDYIRLENNEAAAVQQVVLISSYIAENEGFDFAWLCRVRDAVLYMDKDKDFYQGYGLAVGSWFAPPKTIIDYLPMLGTLYYLLTDTDSEHDKNNVLRAGMYLKNMKSDYLLRRSPSEGVVRGLQFIAWIRDNGIADVRCLDQAPEFEYPSVYRKDDRRLGYFRKDYDADRSNIGRWELFSWSITNRQIPNHDLNRFLRANHDFIFMLVDFLKEEDPDRILEDFYNKIFLKRKEDDLCASLMAHGDIAIHDGGGSWNLGPYLERYCLLFCDDDESYWNRFMHDGDVQKHVEMVGKYLKDATADPHPYKLPDHEAIYCEMAKSLDYMSKRLFLWREEDNERIRVILLKSVQASTSNSRELCVQYLHDKISGSTMNDYRSCLVELDGSYYLEFIYEWEELGGAWKCRLGHKDNALSDNQVAGFIERHSEYEWDRSEGILFTAELYRESIDEGYFDGADKMKEFYDTVVKDWKS